MNASVWSDRLAVFLLFFLTASFALADDPAISIVDGKAETNKGKISQIESETNSALSNLQQQIDNIQLISGPQGRGSASCLVISASSLRAGISSSQSLRW